MRRIIPWLVLLLTACARPDDPRLLLEHGSRQQKLGFPRIREPAHATPAQAALFLRDEDPWVVANACGFLGQAHAREYLSDLAAPLTSPETDVANLAGSAIAQLIEPGDSTLLPALRQALVEVRAAINSIEGKAT